jgi:cytochrome c-type biogenesis protein CcmH
MILFIGFAVLAAAVVWAVTRPLLAPTTHTADADSELAVYRDQLTEIEAEREQGLLAGPEAEAARVEIARRLIHRSEEKDRREASAGKAGWARQAAIYAAAALPVAAIGVYLAVGSPELPSRPYASRLETPVEQATAADLVARVEVHLRDNPEDGRGWDVVAPVYMRMGEYVRAAEAFQRAARLLGESPERLAGFARADIMLKNGVVSEPARQAYTRLLKQQPDNIEPKVWLAIAQEQDGDVAGAARQFAELLPDAQEPWRQLIDARLKAANEKLGKDAVPVPETARAAPSSEAQAAIAAMDPEQREKLIADMVDGLAARLKADGNDLAGWMRLVRSYVVLGRRDDATTALASARGQFKGDDKSLSELNAMATSLGLGS